MAMFQVLTAGEVRLTADGKTKTIFPVGATTTRAVVRSTYDGDNKGVGSIAVADDRMYQKIANAGADADWYKVTSTNAD